MTLVMFHDETEPVKNTHRSQLISGSNLGYCYTLPMKPNYKIIAILTGVLLLSGLGFSTANQFDSPAAAPQPAVVQATPLPLTGQGPTGPGPELDAPVHGLYFYSESCSHCQAIYNEVIIPLKEQYGDDLDLRMLKIDIPENYELLIRAEQAYGVAAKDRGLPTTFLGDVVLSGEEPNRKQMAEIIHQAFQAGTLAWPKIPDFNPLALNTEESPTFAPEGVCSDENPEACETDAPIYAAYFYQVGCQSCSRVEADLSYLRSRYPQLIIEEFNVYDEAALADWMTLRAGRDGDFHTPALFIGEQAWIGEEEITPAAVEQALIDYTGSGSERYWENFDPDQVQNGMVERFRSMGWLTVVLAGLIDGLNPCAFATLIFFVSYLTLSGRKGNEVLSVGLSFTLGVFLAYLVIGFGFYKVLDLLGATLNVLGRWVYGLTAALCFGLAVFSLVDFIKVKRGGTREMGLKLPEALRKRINATIRKGRNTQTYVAGAFATGLVISFLELACTGQIYLPTIIFVSSIPELRLRATLFLVLYNLMFIVPLIVVFVLAYFGTTSKDLVHFMEKHAAAVKLAMVVLFFSLASWLTYTLIL